MSIAPEARFFGRRVGEDLRDENALIAGQLRKLVVERLGNWPKEDAEIGGALVRIRCGVGASRHGSHRQETANAQRCEELFHPRRSHPVLCVGRKSDAPNYGLTTVTCNEVPLVSCISVSLTTFGLNGASRSDGNVALGGVV